MPRTILDSTTNIFRLPWLVLILDMLLVLQVQIFTCTLVNVEGWLSYWLFISLMLWALEAWHVTLCKLSRLHVRHVHRVLFKWRAWSGALRLSHWVILTTRWRPRLHNLGHWCSFIKGVSLLHLADTALAVKTASNYFILHDKLIQLFLQVIVLEGE